MVYQRHQHCSFYRDTSERSCGRGKTNPIEEVPANQTFHWMWCRCFWNEFNLAITVRDDRQGMPMVSDCLYISLLAFLLYVKGAFFPSLFPSTYIRMRTGRCSVAFLHWTVCLFRERNATYASNSRLSSQCNTSFVFNLSQFLFVHRILLWCVTGMLYDLYLDQWFSSLNYFGPSF